MLYSPCCAHLIIIPHQARESCGYQLAQAHLGNDEKGGVGDHVSAHLVL